MEADYQQIASAWWLIRVCIALSKMFNKPFLIWFCSGLTSFLESLQSKCFGAKYWVKNKAYNLNQSVLKSFSRLGNLLTRQKYRSGDIRSMSRVFFTPSMEETHLIKIALDCCTRGRHFLVQKTTQIYDAKSLIGTGSFRSDKHKESLR